MKALRVIEAANGTSVFQPLAFPSVYRTGVSDPEVYRRRARGEEPPPSHQLTPCGSLHAINLRAGPISNFASQAGALLTFVVSGQLQVSGSSGNITSLESGEMLLVDEGAVSKLDFYAGDTSRLVQIGVASDWPRDEGHHYGPGTEVPRDGAPCIKRIYTDEQQRSQFDDFEELFAAPTNEWTSGKPMEGFRFLSWEDGLLDWHPGVINQLGIFLSGETEVEVGGGGGAIKKFHAGDICLCEDRTGEGHVDRVRGLAHVILLVVANEHLW